MTPLELREIVKGLPAAAPITEAYERTMPPPRSHPGRQKDHWLGWLANHIERGTLDAGRVYNAIQCPPMLLWLIEQVGLITEPIEHFHRTDHGGRRCTIIRKAFPWPRLESVLRRKA